MTASAILFGVGLALLAGYYISRPFRRGIILSGERQPESRRLELLQRKAAVYAAIQEIDSDVALGKLEIDDHRLLRNRYVAEGVAVLKALDGMPPGDSVDAAIEADVARLWEGEPVLKRVCPACGAPADGEDLFCAACGARLGELQ